MSNSNIMVCKNLRLESYMAKHWWVMRLYWICHSLYIAYIHM